MMYRDVDLVAEKTVDDSGTLTVDLDVTDPITLLTLYVGVTNGTDAALRAVPAKIIGRIEVVDGGTVYASLTGVQAAGISFYDTGHYPPCWYTEVPSAGQNVAIPIHFGRFVGDPLRNFNAVGLRNPQLKVTWAKNALHLTAYVKLGVRTKVMDGASPASSCLFTKSVRAFTTVASGVENTELPTDFPIRRLYVHPYLADELPYEVISNYKLDCDQGKFIPFDIAADDLIREIEREYGFCSIRQMTYRENATFADSFLGRCWAASCGSGDAGYIVSAQASGTPYVYMHATNHDGGSVSETSMEIDCVGSLPHYVHLIPFGLEDDPASWFNAAAFRKVVLGLTQGVAAGTCDILVQQDRPI